MAAGDVSYKITETGYNELRAKLKDHDGLFGPPYRTAMTNIGRAGMTSVQASAPFGANGRLVTNVRVAKSSAKIPRFVRIVEAARNDKGFAYARVLEFSPFAQSRYRKGVNKHRFWMRRAIDRIVPVVDAEFNAAADGVVREWAA